MLAMEELLAGGRCLKITRSTDNALFISVHNTGEPRALFKWRINCNHLHTDSAVTAAVAELVGELHSKNLLIRP